jgi:hypothetical protein
MTVIEYSSYRMRKARAEQQADRLDDLPDKRRNKMQPFQGSTESLSDRNLRLSYYAEENGRLLASSTRRHPLREAIGQGLIHLGSRLASVSEIGSAETRHSHV